MLYVYSNGISEVDRNNFGHIMSYTQVQQHEIRYVDLNYEDVKIEEKGCVIAVGTVAIKAVIADLAKKKIYSATQLVGKDCIDEARKFFLYCIPQTFTEMISTQEDKDQVWAKLTHMEQVYREWVPFNDPIPNLGEEAPVIEDTTGETTNKDTTATPVDTGPVEEFSPEEVGLNVLEVLNALFEHVSLTDAGLGKSLSKYEKFTLKTSSGDLDVYPTNRMPKDGTGFQICFKDLVTLVKLGVQVNARTITFEAKDGAIVS